MVEREFKWVMRVLRSCQNKTHLNGVEKLIELFHNKWNNEFYYNNLRMTYREMVAII